MALPSADQPVNALLAGRLQREYLLPFSHPPRLNQLGGSLAYSAAALAAWGGRANLVARVNRSFPLQWLERLAELGFDLGAIRTAEEPFDDRFFAAYRDPLTPSYENPLPFFAERALEFPPDLLGYDPAPRRFCSKTTPSADSLRVMDIPKSFMETPAAHLCALDFVSHKTLISVLKAGMTSTLTLRASDCYMDPGFWQEMGALLADLTAFFVTETQALKLFQGRSVDIWDIAGELSAYGPEYVVVNRPDGSAWLYDRATQSRQIVPAYPARLVCPAGALPAFDGGFLLNYRKDYDPLEGVLCGQVSASFAQEGVGPYYLLDALPELMTARLEALRYQVLPA